MAPVVALDCGYLAAGMTDACSDVDVQLVIRLSGSDRVFHRPAPPRASGANGRPAKYGARFGCADPDTWGTPDATLAVNTDKYGQVKVQAWHGLSPKITRRGWFTHHNQLPVVTGTVIHLKVQHLPDQRLPQKDLWLWWAAPEGTPFDLDVLWRTYLRCFDIEHFFRFAKRVLGQTAAKTRNETRL